MYYDLGDNSGDLVSINTVDVGLSFEFFLVSCFTTSQEPMERVCFPRHILLQRFEQEKKEKESREEGQPGEGEQRKREERRGMERRGTAKGGKDFKMVCIIAMRCLFNSCITTEARYFNRRETIKETQR